MKLRVALFALAITALAACGGRHTSSTIPPLGNQLAGQGPGATGGRRGPRAVQDYVSAVMADAPDVFWRLNETSGTTAVDSSGHGYNGTYGASVSHGGPAAVVGDTTAVFPGGTASSATVVTSPARSPVAGGGAGAFSIELWVNVPASVSGTQTIWQQSWQSAALPNPCFIALNGGSSPFFTLQINANGTVLAAYATPVLGAPNHVVMTWDAHTLTAYVNGVATSGGTGSGPISNVSSPNAGFTIGGPVDTHTGLQGSAGEFALYHTALPATRVSAHYNAGAARVPTPPPYVAAVMADSPIAFYRLNETYGTVAADSSGNGHNATYGAGVTHGGPALVAGDTSAVFPGGTASAATVVTSPKDAALAVGSDGRPFSAELWVNVPASVSGTQTIWQQSWGSSALPNPAYIALNGGSSPFFTVQINASGTTLTAYAPATLGTPNHVVLTWDTHTLTAYVNGNPSSGGTASAPLVNYSSPYVGFAIGGPLDAHTGYQGSVSEFALYQTALTAARVNAHYSAGGGSPGTIVWQTGGGPTLGQYLLPGPDNGQCAGTGPVLSGANASFTIVRNTNSTTVPGASSCWRNQINPVDSSTGTNFLLNIGSHYTFTFQTVVTLNGNYVYQDGSGYKVDLPGFVWQTHSYGGKGQPCDALVLDNTYVAYVNNNTQYGSPGPGGLPIWVFRSCDENDFSPPAYNSADTIHDGQVDNWQIDITAQLQGQTGGSIVTRRNGTVVYNAPTSVCDNSTTSCFWNFGPYLFYWEDTQMPASESSAGVTVQINGMTLRKQ